MVTKRKWTAVGLSVEPTFNFASVEDAYHGYTPGSLTFSLLMDLFELFKARKSQLLSLFSLSQKKIVIDLLEKKLFQISKGNK